MLRPRNALLAAVLATAALATPAAAYERTVCVASLFQVACVPAAQPSAKVIRIEGEDGLRHEDVTDDERRAWVARCQPRKVVVEHTSRWLYAQPGCEDGP